ncbi:hypothetical protein LEP1GSC124_1066, partial [Leptospira interrogans serovar Pyrogenes str. 200701872]
LFKKQNLESTINLIHERLWRGNRQSTRNRSNFTKEKQNIPYKRKSIIQINIKLEKRSDCMK